MLQNDFFQFVELLPIHVSPRICKLIQPRGRGDTLSYGLYRYTDVCAAG